MKDEAIALEKTINGTSHLLKVCFSALNRLLVEKGVITKDELNNAFIKELERRPRTQKKQQ